ncbi:unnamed protein product [Sphacelaria rigidula]
MIMHDIVMRPLTSHPYKAGTEHAGFSPDQARAGVTATIRRGDCSHLARICTRCSRNQRMRYFCCCWHWN